MFVLSYRPWSGVWKKQRNRHLLAIRPYTLPHWKTAVSSSLLFERWVDLQTKQWARTADCPTPTLRTNYVGEYPIIPTWISRQSYKSKGKVVIPIQTKRSHDSWKLLATAPGFSQTLGTKSKPISCYITNPPSPHLLHHNYLDLQRDFLYPFTTQNHLFLLLIVVWVLERELRWVIWGKLG